MDPDRFYNIDGVNETVLINIHAEARQVPSVTQRREPLMTSTFFGNISVNDVQMVQSYCKSVFRVSQNHLKVRSFFF
jgi:hypothetical protein